MRLISLLVLLFVVPVTAYAWGVPLYPPVPPTLSLTAPSTGFIDEVVLIDARASTGVHNKPQSNGTYSFTMDFGDGTPLVYIPASAHAYRDAGTYTIRINGKNAAGEAATELTQNITISAIPAATGSCTGNQQCLTDSGNRETNKTLLQDAIDDAAAANTVEQEIILPNDFDVNGQINMVAPAGNKYITIKWSGLSGLPHKKRIDPPSNSNYPTMPTIFARNDLAEGAYAIRVPSPQTASVIKYYRWQGIHITRTSPSLPCGVLAETGVDAYNGNDDLAKMPRNFIFDRMWFDSGGIATAALNNTCLSGLKIKGNYASVVDSYLAHFRLIGAGIDAEAMSISISQGPNAVVNNYLVGSSENFNQANGAIDYRLATISSPTTTSATLSNGLHRLIVSETTVPSDTVTQYLEVGSILVLPSASCVNGLIYCVEMTTLVTGISGNNITFEAVPYTPTNGGQAHWNDTPRFLEFRQNYCYKPNEWRQFLADGTTTNPVWDGEFTQNKNIWESKSGPYTVVDSNVFRNVWAGAQPYIWGVSNRNFTGLFADAAGHHQVQWSNNIHRDAASGGVIAGTDDGDQLNKVSFGNRDFFIVNNLYWNGGYFFDQGGSSSEILHLSRYAYDVGKVKRIFVMHNTFEGYYFYICSWGAGDGAVESMWFNNIHEFGISGFVASDGGHPPDNQRENIIARLPPGDATSWTKNMVVNPRFTATFGTYAPMPATAIVVGGVAANGSATGDTVVLTDQFVNYAAGNFTLVGSSPGKNAASDGTDVGINYPALLAATLNTVTGDWTGAAGGAATVITGKVTLGGRISVQ